MALHSFARSDRHIKSACRQYNLAFEEKLHIKHGGSDFLGRVPSNRNEGVQMLIFIVRNIMHSVRTDMPDCGILVKQAPQMTAANVEFFIMKVGSSDPLDLSGQASD
jgi:hypothetical protein